MRASRYIRRGLTAFATVAMLSVGFAGVAGAQSPGAVIDGDDAIVWNPVPGYSYEVVHADGVRSSLIGLSTGGGVHDVVVNFLPDFDGAAIMNPGPAEDVIAQRQ
jgi:hypothetical protein